MTNRLLLRSPQQRITLIYLLAAALWIFFSDGLLLFFFDIDEGLIPGISIIKGILFVLVTSLILYRHLRHEFEQRFQLEAELQERIEQARRSQVEVEQSEYRFRKAIEEAPHPIALFADDREILTLSRAWLEITGYTRDQLATLDDWAERAYGVGKAPVMAGIDRLFDLESRVDEGEFTITCADGSQRVWLFSSTPLDRLPDGRRIVMSIATDITEQKRAEGFILENERLKARFQKEQERNLFVQRIISALSHDLRTPLTNIASAKEMLALYYDRMDDDRRRERLATIERQVQFALELLEDTVSLARGNRDDVPFRPAPVNIAALCRVSVDELQSTEHNGRRVRFSNHSSLEIAAVDEVLVSRILVNLLSNALKYSPHDSEVRLELDQADHRLILRVIDRGIGIQADDLPHIFEPFYRAANSGDVDGTGLGLSIVKDCVNRHHGHISVESTPAQGSTFTVELPLETTADPVAT